MMVFLVWFKLCCLICDVIGFDYFVVVVIVFVCLFIRCNCMCLVVYCVVVLFGIVCRCWKYVWVL